MREIYLDNSATTKAYAVSYTHLDVYKRQDMETFSKEASSESGSLVDQIRVENRQRMDYREFLRK